MPYEEDHDTLHAYRKHVLVAFLVLVFVFVFVYYRNTHENFMLARKHTCIRIPGEFNVSARPPGIGFRV